MSCTSSIHNQSNKGVIDSLAHWLEDLDFDIKFMEVEDNPGKYNLVASRGRGDKGLVLAGHTDTVPCNPELWQQDPFQLIERDNRFYGLGATDMKGFFPVVLAALEAFKDRELKQPIIVLATADEESSMSGARALTQSDIPGAGYAIIGEPTGMKPIRMHKGMMMESIRVIGQAGHSSNPSLGNNALEAMHTVIGELLSYRSQLQSRYNNPGFDIAIPTMNLGCIHGGDNPNRICGQCELHFDLRPLPGMPLDDMRKGIQDYLSPLAEVLKCDIVFSSLFPGIEPFEQLVDSTIVKTVKQLTGHDAESVAFATEAPFLQRLGMETLIMGPGSINQAHQPNEYIEQSQIQPAVDIIEQLIKRICF